MNKIYGIAVLALASVPSFAYDFAADATAAQTDMESAGSSIIPVALAIVAMVAGARLVIKLINRAVGK